MDWLRSKGLDRVRLEVISDNTEAIGFYQSLGFYACYTVMEAILADGSRTGLEEERRMGAKQ